MDPSYGFFEFNMIYFISGASGSGKSAIIPNLKNILGDRVRVYNFDDFGVPEGAGKKWRQESTEKWLQKLIQEEKDVCLLGQLVLGEILACPSAKQIDHINFCLLDVDDFERIKRLKTRNTHGVDQNMLNWSSWLRMHHQDPKWMQQILKDNAWEKLDFTTWDNFETWDNKANVTILDTSDQTITQVAQSVSNWILENKQGNIELIPDTSYKLYSNVKHAFNIVDQKVIEHDKKCVPATQDPDMIYLNYVIKENDEIIAGIFADVYIWKILFIELIFVHEEYRHKKLGSFLIQKVEQEARTLGAKLAHLDSFDFQAKDFYIKQGYEVFGVLEDCPPGHKRFYLKKNL